MPTYGFEYFNQYLNWVSTPPPALLVIAEYPLSPPVGPMATEMLCVLRTMLGAQGSKRGGGAAAGARALQVLVAPLRRSTRTLSVRAGIIDSEAGLPLVETSLNI